MAPLPFPQYPSVSNNPLMNSLTLPFQCFPAGFFLCPLSTLYAFLDPKTPFLNFFQILLLEDFISFPFLARLSQYQTITFYQTPIPFNCHVPGNKRFFMLNWILRRLPHSPSKPLFLKISAFFPPYSGTLSALVIPTKRMFFVPYFSCLPCPEKATLPQGIPLVVMFRAVFDTFLPRPTPLLLF